MYALESYVEPVPFQLIFTVIPNPGSISMIYISLLVSAEEEYPVAFISPVYEIVSFVYPNEKSSVRSMASSYTTPASTPRQASAPRHGDGTLSLDLSSASAAGASKAPSIGKQNETIINIVRLIERFTFSFIGVT